MIENTTTKCSICEQDFSYGMPVLGTADEELVLTKQSICDQCAFMQPFDNTFYSEEGEIELELQNGWYIN